MTQELCPVAYDHNDDLEECMLCGWGAPVEKPLAHGPKDMSALTGPEKIRETIARLNGAYAPTQRITFRCKGDNV